jgi:hypothetical protein
MVYKEVHHHAPEMPCNIHFLLVEVLEAMVIHPAPQADHPLVIQARVQEAIHPDHLLILVDHHIQEDLLIQADLPQDLPPEGHLAPLQAEDKIVDGMEFYEFILN